MDKNQLERVKEVCAKHEVDAVYLTGDGHIFLPIAKSLAKAHARRKDKSCHLVDASGNILEEKTSRKGKSNPNATTDPENRGVNVTKESLMVGTKAEMLEFAKSKGIEVDNSETKDKISDKILAELNQ